MSDISVEFGKFLNRRFEQKNREEGRSFSEPLTWRELSVRMNLPETNLIRWKEGLNVPSNPAHISALVNEFGEEVMVVLGLIDHDTALYIRHRNDPEIQRVMQEIRQAGSSKRGEQLTV